MAAGTYIRFGQGLDGDETYTPQPLQTIEARVFDIVKDYPGGISASVQALRIAREER